PPPEPRRVVPGPVVVQPGLLVALLAAVAVALRARLELARHGLVGGAAIREVLLVRDHLAVGVELEARRAQLVVELEPAELRRSIVATGGAGLDQRDPAPVVHHVQSLARQRDRAPRVAPAVDLEGAEVEALLGAAAGAGRAAVHDLADALAAGVVDVA